MDGLGRSGAAETSDELIGPLAGLLPCAEQLFQRADLLLQAGHLLLVAGLLGAELLAERTVLFVETFHDGGECLQWVFLDDWRRDGSRVLSVQNGGRDHGARCGRLRLSDRDRSGFGSSVTTRLDGLVRLVAHSEPPELFAVERFVTDSPPPELLFTGHLRLRDGQAEQTQVVLDALASLT